MVGNEISVLVLGAGGNVGEGILKALARSSLRCRVVGADVNPLRMGLFSVDRALVSPWAHTPEFVAWLEETCAQETIDVVLCGAEPVLLVLARHAAALRAATGATCIVSGGDVLEIGDDKFRTARWLEEHCFATPRTCRTEDLAALEDLAAQCGYPLVAKPRRGGGSRGHLLLQERDDLLYAARKRDYIVQEYVGTPAEEYTAGCFVDREGAVRGVIVMRRELHEGTTVRAQLGEFREIRDTARAIAAKLRPQGPCNIQLRMHRGEPVCFEINIRFSGTTPVRAWFGYNEVDAAIRHFALGEPCPDLPVVTEGGMVRYWNEMYVSAEGMKALGSDATACDGPRAFVRGVEGFGKPDAASG